MDEMGVSTDMGASTNDMGVSTDMGASTNDMGVSTDMGASTNDMGVSTDQIDDNRKDINDHISKKNDENDSNHSFDKINDEDEDENEHVENYKKISSSHDKRSTVLSIDRIKSPKNKDDFRFLRYPTMRIKTIKRALSLCGHTIVG
jgi:hypothetical protein